MDTPLETDANPAEAKKKTYFRRDRLERWYFASEVLGKVGLALAGLFALFQFMQSQEEQKVSRTIGYIDRYERGDIAQARKHLRASLRPYEKQFVELGNSGISSDDKKEIVLLLIEEDNEGQIAESLEVMADFYDALSLCVNGDLCSSTVMKNYFCPKRTQELWDNFEPYFLSRRSNNPEFGRNLEVCAVT